jgi:hypothetical protein
MKITNAIFESKQYFITIGKIHNSDQLSVMEAYRINRLVKKLNELNKEYDEIKRKILSQYGTPGEKEGTFSIESENKAAFSTEYNDLVAIEHDLEMEMLTFPSKIEDGFSATDLVVMEMFFDLSGLEEDPAGNEIVITPEKFHAGNEQDYKDYKVIGNPIPINYEFIEDEPESSTEEIEEKTEDEPESSTEEIEEKTEDEPESSTEKSA